MAKIAGAAKGETGLSQPRSRAERGRRKERTTPSRSLIDGRKAAVAAVMVGVAVAAEAAEVEVEAGAPRPARPARPAVGPIRFCPGKEVLPGVISAQG